jgi:uncharacterized MFS-type transporter YbfB
MTGLPVVATLALMPVLTGDARWAALRFVAGCASALVFMVALEGVGYIIADTFLVAAIDQTASTTLGSSAWIIVGVAAVPSAALWAGLSRIWSRPTLPAVALGAQAVGIAFPALVGGTTAALASAVLFGASFLGLATVALATGAHLRTPRTMAILTTRYSVGQIAGRVLVTPTLHHSYQSAPRSSRWPHWCCGTTSRTTSDPFPAGYGPPDDRRR